MTWVEHLAIRDLRNIRHTAIELHPGINVFQGRNAQGKTSLLEAVGLLARGRSFRTEDTQSMIRRGAPALLAEARRSGQNRAETLAVELRPQERVYRLNGRAVSPAEYMGRIDVVVYSTDRLRVVRGTMRDRRQFLDRQASALWPSYRAQVRRFERVLAQRNAALQSRARDLDAWTERFIEDAAALRLRRAHYAMRLSAALQQGFRPSGETYDLRPFEPADGDEASREQLRDELRDAAPRERGAGRSLAGPHRDPVALLLDGRDAALAASSGQARSLLLGLTLASLRVYAEETGRSAIALLDDLDSELDEERACALCAEVVQRGQALVTSAHLGWAERLRSLGRVYHVSEGQVRAA